jgi:hypothetical protein
MEGRGILVLQRGEKAGKWQEGYLAFLRSR